MITTKFNQAELEKLIEIFLNVYSGPPWNDKWVKSRAVLYLKAFISDPLFIGYSAYHSDHLIGACFGIKKYWWKGDEYYIHEFFIDRAFQRKGFGSLFLNQIQQRLTKVGIKTIALLTKKGTSADNFYITNGFKNIENLTFKYKNF